MEKGLLLKAEIRENTGSKAAEKARRLGRVPGIIYGHKEVPVAVSLDQHDLVEGLHHRHRLIDVQIGKKKEKMIVKDLQYDYLGKDIIHIDLMRVDVSEMLKVMVPVEFKGTAKGAQEGGVLTIQADRLEVECKVTDIPEHFVVSVKEMKVGDTIHASDVTLPEGVKLISSPATLLVSCSIVAEVKTTEQLEVEAPAVPEVIGEVKETAEESAEETKKDEKKEKTK